MNAHTPTLETQIRETEEEEALIWAELEPLLRTHSAVQEKKARLYDQLRKDAAA